MDEVLGVAVRQAVPLGGGAARVVLADGRTVVVKDGPAAQAEAAGLRWLAVPGAPPVPTVLDVRPDRLVTTLVPPGRPSRAAAEELGRGLAVLHAAGAPAFGAGPPGGPQRAWIGAAPMRNVVAGTGGTGPAAPGSGGAPGPGRGPGADPVGADVGGSGGGPGPGRGPGADPAGADVGGSGGAPGPGSGVAAGPAAAGAGGRGWAEWYAAERVEPYLRTARDRGDLTAAEAGLVQRVCAALPSLAGPPEPPARLHGDLWSGNVLWAPSGAWLIDPAAHGGHRETDLAMLALFGCPHLDAVVAAYDAAAPPAPGWRERVPLHQLFPLLVHVVLFGRGYAGQACAAARAALRAG